jgi:hypothetical protein
VLQPKQLDAFAGRSGKQIGSGPSLEFGRGFVTNGGAGAQYRPELDGTFQRNRRPAQAAGDDSGNHLARGVRAWL